MPRYEIKGRGKDAGRKRKRIYLALTEIEARQQAEEDGTQVEEIIELPPEPPTERQLDYAKGLSISIPPNATKNDLSDLISLKIDKDKPTTERHRAFAKVYGIETTDYIGKKSMFDHIQSALVLPGREEELLAWFTFRVYRDLINGIDKAQIDCPDNPIIKEIAEQLVNDEKIITSVRRYEGRELIWFGEQAAPDGYTHTGGSNRTTAYKHVSSLLKERVNFSKKQQIKATSPAQARSLNKKYKNESKGCLSVIFVTITIPISFVMSIVWLSQFFS